MSEPELILRAPPKSLAAVLRALGSAAPRLYNHLLLLGTCALLVWITLPTVVLPGLGIGVMFALARQAQRSPAPDFNDLLPALRVVARRSLALWAITLAVTALMLFNLRFYSLALPVLVPLWTVLIVLWGVFQLYAWAISAADPELSLREIARYAAIFTFARPLTTLIVAIGSILLTALSIALPFLLLFLPALLALWATALLWPGE